jgi:rhamnosyltransferase
MTAKSSKVLAVVVTHHPDADLAARLRAIAEQVGALVVVDNGSPNLAEIEAAASGSGARLTAWPENRGIAAALNAGAKAMLEGDFTWLAMFDQDSRIPPGAIAALLDLHRVLSAPGQVAILAMSRRDRVTGRDYHRPGDIRQEAETWRAVRTTITSGSLVRREALERVGLFDEQLFIDGVDHDYCLRCRSAGFRVIEAKAVAMDHSIGAITKKRFLGREGVLTHHSADRRYYITRNTLELSRRWLLADPIWALREVIHLLLWNFTAAAFETDRGAKLAAMVEGALHFATRRFGPRRRPASLAGRD